MDLASRRTVVKIHTDSSEFQGRTAVARWAGHGEWKRLRPLVASQPERL
jgi:hypothetical protein